MESVIQSQAGNKLIRILAFTLVITVMSATMFNIVLPQIAADFELTLSQVSWITSAFLLIYAIGTVTYGKLADKYRLKSLLTFGLCLFVLGSIVGLMSQSFGMALLGRILQATGAAVIPATAGIIPIRYFPPEQRGRAIGISMSGLAIGGAIGPIVAALLVSVVHWRWLFCMPLLTLLALPYFRKYLNDMPSNKARIDWLGGGLLAGAIAMLLLAITNQTWALAAGCILLFILFLVRIHIVPEPFIKPILFKSKPYSSGLAMMFLISGMGYSLVFLSPQMFAHVNQLAPGLIGLAMVPAAAMSALLGRKGGKLADQKGNSFLYYMAASLVIVCFMLMSTFAGVSPGYVAVILILGNVGQTFLYISMSNMISRSLPMEHSGVGMGVLAMLNFISGAIAAGVYGRIVDHGAGMSLNPLSLYPGASVYSNIYLFIAVLHTGILLFYYVQFGRDKTALASKNLLKTEKLEESTCNR